jgi:UDP-N-acetylmuramate--alanine ligase
MSALALVALSRGVRVTGSDADISGCGELRAAGAILAEGAAPELAAGARAVVASAAIPEAHPDLERARRGGLPVVPRKRALAELLEGVRVVAIAGTHGKTTTTVMTAEAFAAAGLDPTALAGGRMASWGGNARIGSGEWCIVEADEYDQAFLALEPTIAVVNNVEADHLECYGSVEAMEAAFVEFAGRARTILIGDDGEGADRVAERLGGRALRFGPGARDVDLRDLAEAPSGSSGTIRWADGFEVTVRLQVPGRHNLRNAAGALAAVRAAGGDPRVAAAALAGFGGVGRRFERLGEHDGVTYVDDYAHHPTEVSATLAAARQAFPGRRIVAVFQPHLYSRTALHGPALGRALAAADLPVVTGIYPAREAPIPGVTGEAVAVAAREAGRETLFVPARGEVSGAVRALLRPGDVLLTMGAGDITRLAAELGAR